jgi:electron transfer flavoprotein alpha subunit
VIRILVIAEHDGTQLNSATGRCVSCAICLKPSAIDVVVLGDQSRGIADACAQLAGVSRVLLVDLPATDARLAAALAPEIAMLASNGYSHVLGPSTTFGKDLMPRVAALLGVGQLSDIMTVDSAYQFQRPIYAGNAIITVTASESLILVATVRTASFKEPGVLPVGSAPVEPVSRKTTTPTHTRFIELQSAHGDRPDLQSASRVVSGGRGLGSADHFRLLQTLAESLGAAVGASRAAVDSGYAPNELQVGQTGKIIAPELYIAVGISGAIQHLTGIKDAGTIVAINKDADAPIFDVADIGLVADLFEAIPQLIAMLENRR